MTKNKIRVVKINVRDRCIVLVFMKIQPIQLNYNIYTTRYVSTKQPNDIPSQNIIDRPVSNISNVFYFPVNFTGSTSRDYGSDKRELMEKTGDFKLARFNGVTCPACGAKMINHSKMKRIYSDLSKLQPDEYLDYLGQYKEYMRPVERSVYDEIYAMSQKPGASKDIRELVVSLRDQKLPVLQKAQMRQIKKMRALARTLPEQEKLVLNKKLNVLQKIVYKTKSNSPFRRKIMIDRMSKIKISNPKKYEKFKTYLYAFPTSKDMNSAWIVKYSGKNKQGNDWTSFEIANRFLSSSIANTDHIIAYDIENNHDDISNYMAMHNACNCEKSNKPFLQWMYEDKDNRIKYMKQYFEDAQNLISSKIIRKKKYRKYVSVATETVSMASKGQIPASTIAPIETPIPIQTKQAMDFMQ